MYCLCYISTRNEKLNDDVLKEILTQSRISNQNKELTGLLVLMDNQFLQILEGEEEEVNSLYNKICKDTRHSYVQKIYSGELDKRNFASWDMAFHEIHWEDLEDAGLLTQYENGGKLSDYLKDKNHYVIEYLKSLNGIEKLQLNLPK